MLRSLVGSEMCIRDSPQPASITHYRQTNRLHYTQRYPHILPPPTTYKSLRVPTNTNPEGEKKKQNIHTAHTPLTKKKERNINIPLLKHTQKQHAATYTINFITCRTF
eukprot:TRINITY_DN62447_c0_g1_i2.p1 TRINITY_DN62447_c0_g1~~TRINITY_DN62447_c0_g1_i2.p1  ORF type:complete len:108 (-),score=4.63 TRINITY_DN62447_c0_g1_i2:286-609(-)